ncbi:GntR family transcriptional regulator [Curvivirga aplysinae]|uniref:GntR family transcriptional regulator n=1 Tax=Curvivirga aplysinae TaxID=2529852 RepID=UPI0012BBC382|nr:GntR family transcriptional regulator [Curvivirga aplysinae]MTI08558.1 GntR family transcriptional regulator [Curvivirga aplysinae]
MSLIQLENHDDINDVDVIQEIIRNRICFLEYPAGTTLKETALAEEFGVSRTPLREALNRLRYLGLIETRNGVGTVVVGLSYLQITQIYEMRMELAQLIGKLSPNKITDEHEEIALSLLTRAQRQTIEFDIQEYFAINHQLHHLIYDIIGNASLKEMWKQLYFQSASSWYQVAKNTTEKVCHSLIDEITDLVTAIKSRDAEAVGISQRLHIKYGFERIKLFNQ